MQLARRTVLLVLTVAIAAACDRTPVDPGAGATELAASVFGEEAAALVGVPMSLPALVQSAMYRVYTDHGADAARAMLTDLRRLQQNVDRAGADRESAAGHQRALHDEQLSIVLRVFGSAVVSDVLEAVPQEAVRLRARLTETPGAGAVAAGLLEQAEALLVAARVAADDGESRAALDAATRAAALLDMARDAIAESLRVPGLDELFERSAAELRQAGADGRPAALARLAELRQAAREAVRSGDRQSSHEALRAVRMEQVRIVLGTLGTEPVRRMIDDAAAALALLDEQVAVVRAAGGDAARLERMAASARDLLLRADAALHAGDPALALDLAAHGASVTNGIRLALEPR